MNRAIFLDRDGVITQLSYEPDGVVMPPSNLSQVKILPKAKEAIQEMRELGFKIIGVTNQPGVAFGYLKEDSLREINSFLKKELNIDEIYSCIHHPKYTGDCECRKPKIGLLKQAEKDFNLDIAKSYIVGDNLSDIETGKNAGVLKTFRIGKIREDMLEIQYEKNIFPDFTFPDLLEVSKKIKSLEERIYKIQKLELGSGAKPSLGYLHQDVTQLQGVDLDFVCNPWQINLPENSLSEVLALGVMEHLRYEDFRKTLSHMNKLLNKQGEFLFDVPDMKVWSEYLYNLTHGMSDKNPFPDEHIWATTYGWQRWPGDEHKSGWTREMLLEAVKSAGFSQIEEGSQIYTSKGIIRGRFTRPGDAHIYIKAIK